ncbi:MAG TPA: hypothetical protein VIL49_10145, partial [Capillimicrobium sp.]
FAVALGRAHADLRPAAAELARVALAGGAAMLAFLLPVAPVVAAVAGLVVYAVVLRAVGGWPELGWLRAAGREPAG